MVVKPTDAASMYAANSLVSQDKTTQASDADKSQTSNEATAATESPAVKATISTAALETARAVQETEGMTEEEQVEDVAQRDVMQAAREMSAEGTETQKRQGVDLLV